MTRNKESINHYETTSEPLTEAILCGLLNPNNAVDFKMPPSHEEFLNLYNRTNTLTQAERCLIYANLIQLASSTIIDRFCVLDCGNEYIRRYATQQNKPYWKRLVTILEETIERLNKAKLRLELAHLGIIIESKHNPTRLRNVSEIQIKKTIETTTKCINELVDLKLTICKQLKTKICSVLQTLTLSKFREIARSLDKIDFRNNAFSLTRLPEDI